MKHNLPVEPNRFVGRQRDSGEVRDLLHTRRVVTLCGTGGIGKTRLAVKVALELAQGKDFPDGVWLVELAKISRPELVIQEFSRVLGVHEEGGRTLLDSLRGRLAGADMLLVVDNCEHLVDAAAALIGTLIGSCPDVRFLVTSREPLRISGELLWRLPPLELPEDGDTGALQTESVQLFLDRALGAGTRLPPETVRAVADLCRALDGMPLALELAAARTSVLSPEQIADRIGDRFRLLTTGDRTAPARQQTLLATVEWSYDLLAARERTLLRRLSVFAGQFTLELAEAVCGDRILSMGEILEVLGSLVDKSLVLSELGDHARYRLPETIRQFAADRLEEEDERARFRNRHLRVVCELHEREHEILAGPRGPWPQRAASLARSDAMADDLRAALAWALESDNALYGLRIVRSLAGDWCYRGSWNGALDWLDRILKLHHPDVPLHIVGGAKLILAWALIERDELTRALEIALEGLRDEERAEDVETTGGPIVTMILLRMGDVDRAQPYIEATMEQTRGRGSWQESAALGALTSAAMIRGRLREAQRHGEESLEVARDSGNIWTEARALTALGTIAEIRGDLEAAQGQLEAAIPLLTELGYRVELARGLGMLGRVLARRHDFQGATAAIGRSLTISRETGQQRGIARGLAGLAVLATERNDPENAVLAIAAATRLREPLGVSSSTITTDHILGKARVALGEGRVTSLWAQGRRADPDDVIKHLLEGQALAEPPTVKDEGPPQLLTAREREIAELLTRGLSNRAIAEELVISPATVARHIANMMVKLGFTSRAQIAAWASGREDA